MKMTRKQQAQETKKHIYLTALTLFQTKGFDQVTVDEIVQQSNSSKGAFYGHFSSKYDIFLEKFKEIDHFYEEFTTTLPVNLSFKEKVISLIDAQMTYLKDDLGMDLMRSVYKSGLIENERNFFSNSERKLYKILHSFIQKAIKDGELSVRINVQETVIYITRCMRGSLYDWLVFGKDFDLLQESTGFIAIFLDGLLLNKDR
ncbi:TetR family transcriptional regulator [Lysinibacillus sphaericus]|uniref:TetR/AcrR family transcriptional regulator n=1 Tax=Lysinibacillus sphaericus TaxID=1421 RepID=UPI0018CD79DB|nr:TetR/AcrR family transcriptional regulator [Lysinibacillus sphaericus]MBG9453692.1 TetR family transcriptional regulator [Lysinibacillus sphaericus]MBG9476163.1 TetR family transcriptional regulator [Lysinibacillus sphaericus]MBG9591577.1 TetR family transcriptional regulator [Lysinibacillus sphaericus]